MKYFLAVCVSVLLLSYSVFAQKDKFLKHTVVKGETITQIAQKYRVTPYAIYQLNPDAQNGIQLNSVLLIPTETSKGNDATVSNSNGKTHKVTAKETWYSISKEYKVSVSDLEKANSEAVATGLKIGQVIVIPGKNGIKTTETKSDKAVYHEVLPKETKYSISKKYNVTIEQLEKQNPEIINGLSIGFQLLISGKKQKNEFVREDKVFKEEILKVKTAEFDTYEVQPNETLYSLTKEFGITPEKLISLNPELVDGVKDGMILKVPVKVVKKKFIDLSKSITTTKRKELVLLLPFNLSKFESDSINSTAAKLKTDKFLNITLDFYSGALMAIDSARAMGLNVNVKILDSQENLKPSNFSNFVQQNKLVNANAIIGPFYQSNVDKIAELVKEYNVPVISPLSKEPGKANKNMFEAMPSGEFVKQAMFDYMHGKNGNILAVIDPKKASSKHYMLKNQKEVKLVGFNGDSRVVLDSLKKHLVKNRLNYVVLESEKTAMIIATTNAMESLMADYQLQLVILESNPTLDFEEIKLAQLTKLNLLYPSLTRKNETPEARQFIQEYKKINNIFPSQFAIRGFDVTFDTLLRLSQEKSFEEVAEEGITEQVENKFNYNKKTAEGGYTNKGVYIAYYDTDLTIKMAN